MFAVFPQTSTSKNPLIYFRYMSINELSRKIKGVAKALDSRDHFAMILILLVGMSCFFCGMLYERERVRKDIIITSSVTEPISADEYPVVEKAQTVASSTIKGSYVGSKSSHKFHLPWCSGAQRMSEVNKVWFTSKEEALAAGYSPAANCPGI